MKKENRTADIADIKLYNLSEIEPIIGVTHRTLRTYVKEGRIKAVKFGNRWKVREDELRRFVDEGSR